MVSAIAVGHSSEEKKKPTERYPRPKVENLSSFRVHASKRRLGSKFYMLKWFQFVIDNDCKKNIYSLLDTILYILYLYIIGTFIKVVS